MAEDTRERKPKLSEVEIAGVTVFLLTMDALDWAEAGVPATDLAAFPSLQAYMYVKGIGQTLTLVTNLLELIPGADYLPLRTSAFLIIAWADRHQDGRLAKLVAKAEKVESTVKGGVGKGAGAGKAGAAAAQAKAGASAGRAGVEAVGEELEAGGSAGRSAGGGLRRGAGKRTGGIRRKGAGGDMEEGGEGEEGGPEEEQRQISPEEEELEEILSGDYVGRVLRENLGAEELLSQIGDQDLGAKPLKFDPDRAIQAKPAAVRPRSPRPQSDDNRYNKEVDLRDAA